MNKYNGLLSSAAHKYHICKGARETENEWKTRLVYSICGMMAYASLWDDSEEDPISIVHLKRKVRSMLENYKSMYPELSGSLPYVSKELEDEIADQFLSTGVVYHRPNRIAPSIKHEEPFGDLLFQRGIALDSISCVSGIGFYSKQYGAKNPDKIKAMFSLGQENLQALWRITLSSASWKSNLSFEQNTEYLRLKPPFSQGYWVNKPNATGTVSILRTGMKGSQLYYLYFYSGTTIEVSPLPQWQVESYNYRSLACACLSTYGTLPPIEYFEDGALVHVHMNYLLPPRELEFLKLYSWPEICTSLLCNFRRKLSIEVFTAIKNVLSDEGYEFKEGQSDAKRSKFCS
ncbi:MAG: hypothetical protein PHG06_18470 [Parabacteroides sp.]|nr:hypothetical protein [Parabacteroides sp.]